MYGERNQCGLDEDLEQRLATARYLDEKYDRGLDHTAVAIRQELRDCIASLTSVIDRFEAEGQHPFAVVCAGTVARLLTETQILLDELHQNPSRVITPQADLLVDVEKEKTG